jgi:hypothetical protein
MDPNTLRGKILCRVAEHEETGSSAYLDDADIAAALDAPLADVQRQMLILESTERLELAKTFGPTYSARLTPKGLIAVEQLTAPPDKPKPPAGF